MSTGSGGKPSSGSSPGRPAADTPQRMIVRSSDGHSDSMMGAHDTAVAHATSATKDDSPGAKRTSATAIGGGPTPAAGMAPISELIGITLSNRYLVTRKVGQGGMGAVYEATHTLIGKRVAVKVLL